MQIFLQVEFRTLCIWVRRAVSTSSATAFHYSPLTINHLIFDLFHACRRKFFGTLRLWIKDALLSSEISSKITDLGDINTTTRRNSHETASNSLDIPFDLPETDSQLCYLEIGKKGGTMTTYQSVTASSHNLISCSLVPP